MKYIILELDADNNIPFEVTVTPDAIGTLAGYDYSDVLASSETKFIVCDIKGRRYDVRSEENLPHIDSKDFRYHTQWTPRLEKSGQDLSQKELEDMLKKYLLRLKSGLVFKKAKFKKSEIDGLSASELLALI